LQKKSKTAPRRFWPKMSSSSTFAVPPVSESYQSHPIYQEICILRRTICQTTKNNRCYFATFFYNGRSNMENNN